ncbi:Cysteine-rich secretory protein family protein [Parafilimonas terrae]|uniref:Cysteine-rich secretory protein family protein n=1 Tax=Parafilimonas terrae TaxID=1465490 RepID=A0A1I5VYE8_9BACT|nr:Cysteine-rich secretory protein family protein [Parafilimonas terrae]
MFHVKQILSIFLLLIAFSCKSQKTLLFREAELPKPEMNDQEIIQWNKAQPGFNRLSEPEKNFLYWVNYSRKNPKGFFESAVMPVVKTYPQLKGANLISLEKDLKSGASLALLQINPALMKMSEAHAKDITSSNANPSHNSTNGETFIDRFKKVGLKNCGGENISYGGGEADPLFMLVMLYLDINVSNLGHRKALMNSSFVNTGISIAKYANGNTFLVEDFACAQ